MASLGREKGACLSPSVRPHLTVPMPRGEVAREDWPKGV